MGKFRKFFGAFQTRHWNESAPQKSPCPVESRPYRADEGLDTIMQELRDVVDSFQDMIDETDKVIKGLTTPRPFTTRSTDE